MKRLTIAVYLAAIVAALCCRSPGAVCVEVLEVDHGGITDAHASGTYHDDDPNAIEVVDCEIECRGGPWSARDGEEQAPPLQTGNDR